MIGLSDRLQYLKYENRTSESESQIGDDKKKLEKETKIYHLHYQMTAHRTLLGGLLKTAVQVVLLTVDLAVHIVERLASQRPATAAAYEAVGMVEVTCRRKKKVI